VTSFDQIRTRSSSVEIAYDVRGHAPVVLCIQGVGVIGADGLTTGGERFFMNRVKLSRASA
jgi:hypothetical protein